MRVQVEADPAERARFEEAGGSLETLQESQIEVAPGEVQELPPHRSTPYKRELLSFWIGLFAIGSAVLTFFIGDSGSSRQLCGVGVDPADDKAAVVRRVWRSAARSTRRGAGRRSS